MASVTPQAKAAAGSHWELPQAQHNKQIVWLTTGKLGQAKLHFSCAVISVPWGTRRFCRANSVIPNLLWPAAI